VDVGPLGGCVGVGVLPGRGVGVGVLPGRGVGVGVLPGRWVGAGVGACVVGILISIAEL